MGLVPYNDTFEMMERFFDNSFTSPSRAYKFVSAFDVEETDDHYVLRADMPGVDEQDIDITVHNKTVVVSAKREHTHSNENQRYARYERTYGSFSRSFTLPHADYDSAEAALDRGVFTLTVPKQASAKPKKIVLGGLGSKIKGLFSKSSDSDEQADQ